MSLENQIAIHFSDFVMFSGSESGASVVRTGGSENKDNDLFVVDKETFLRLKEQAQKAAKPAKGTSSGQIPNNIVRTVEILPPFSTDDGLSPEKRVQQLTKSKPVYLYGKSAGGKTHGRQYVAKKKDTPSEISPLASAKEAATIKIIGPKPRKLRRATNKQPGYWMMKTCATPRPSVSAASKTISLDLVNEMDGLSKLSAVASQLNHEESRPNIQLTDAAQELEQAITVIVKYETEVIGEENRGSQLNLLGTDGNTETDNFLICDDNRTTDKRKLLYLKTDEETNNTLEKTSTCGNDKTLETEETQLLLLSQSATSQNLLTSVPTEPSIKFETSDVDEISHENNSATTSTDNQYSMALPDARDSKKFEEFALANKCQTDFKCIICPYTTRMLGMYKRHFVTAHNNGQPFKCPTCQDTFLYRRLYKVHLNTHTGFNCEYCDKKFSRVNDKNRHILHAHGGKQRL